MISFEKFFVLDEAVFRKSKHNTHYKDFPMFSVFYENKLPNNLGISEEELVNNLNQKLSYISTALQRARNEIGKMGFPSMHANLVFADLSKDINPNTGGKTGGLAYPKRRYMKIDYNQFIKYESFARDVVIHEWAHLWMFSKTRQFREAIEEIYYKIFEKVPQEGKIEELYSRLRIDIRNNTIYHINELATYSWMRNLMKKEYTGSTSESSSYIKERIKNKIKYCIDNGLIKLQLNLQEIDTKEYDFLDELVEQFYNSLIKTIEERPSDVSEVLDTDEIRKNRFYILASWQLDESVANIILEKIKKIYLKYSSNINLYETDLIYFAQGEKGKYFREYLRSLINWYDAYGMSNPDEFWATAIEGFFNLPYEHRRNIVKIMLQHN
jgi:hypothetical protein